MTASRLSLSRYSASFFWNCVSCSLLRSSAFTSAKGFQETGTFSRTFTRCQPNFVWMGSDTDPTGSEKTALSMSAASSPRATMPRSPPLLFVAPSEKSRTTDSNFAPPLRRSEASFALRAAAAASSPFEIRISARCAFSGIRHVSFSRS